MALSKAAILAAKDVKISEPFNIPEWGGDVYFKTLSGAERDKFEENYSQDRMKSFRCRFLVLTMCDENGVRIFDDKDVDPLGEKSASIIGKAFDFSWDWNGLSEKAVDKLGEDSAAGQSGDSISA